MNRRQWRDEELEGLLRETLRTPEKREASEASPAVVAAVMRRVRAEGRLRALPDQAEEGKAAAPLNTLALALAVAVALGWAGSGFWTAQSPALASLVDGALGQLASTTLRWVFQGLTEVGRALLLAGVGDLFPLLLLGTLGLPFFAGRLKRAGR